MFDAVCIRCGRLTDDDSLVYCSDICEAADHAVSNNTISINNSDNNNDSHQGRCGSRSPASSVFISPYLTAGPPAAYIPDIPPLMLPKTRTMSSSASSDVTSVFEYNDTDADSGHIVGDDQETKPSDWNMFHLPPLGISETHPDSSDYENNSTSLSISLKLARRTPISALPFNFARRPAPSDNRALAPALHVRAQVQVHSTQAKSHPSSPSRPQIHSVTTMIPSTGVLDNDKGECNTRTPPTPTLTIRRNKNNRASLPAYFSQLTLTAHSKPSPPILAHINVHVDASSDKLEVPRALTTRTRHHLRGKSDQLIFGRTTEDDLLNNRSVDWDMSVSRTHAMPVPGSMRRPMGAECESPRRERGRSKTRFGIELEQHRNKDDEVERRGRSRVTTHRQVALS